MKHTFVHAIGLSTFGALALTTASIIAAEPPPTIVSRRPNHRTWETTRQVPTPDGKTRTETASYVELQGGLPSAARTSTTTAIAAHSSP